MNKEEVLQQKKDFFEIKIEDDKVLNLEKIFENKHPIYLEIGSGKGEFLSKKSVQMKEFNFLGIELKKRRIVNILKKLDIVDNKNVRLLRLYVDHKINQWIKKDSIDHIYIIHPDPWPKRRHHKNRLIQQAFIDSLTKILKADGIVQISTDHTEYSKWIINNFKQRNDFISVYENHFTQEREEDHITTFFETTKMKEGFNPIFMKFKKVNNTKKEGNCD